MFNTNNFYCKTLAGETITTQYNPKITTVGDIKNQIFNQKGIPVENQNLYNLGKAMSNDSLLAESGWQKNTTVHLIITEQDPTYTESVSNYRSPTPTPYVDQVD